MFDPRKHSVIALAVLLAACASSKPVQTPKLALPVTAAVETGDLSRWWQRFGDARLDALIEQALTRNTDLRAAAARVDEALTQTRAARSEQFPSLDAYARSSRTRNSAETSMPYPQLMSNHHEIGLEIAYEVDLWGRVRRANDAALAQLLASREAMYALRASLAAQVTQTWFSLQALDHRIALTERTLKTREEALELMRRAATAGLKGDLELRQAEAELEAVRARLPNLRAARGRTQRALALLTGESPQGMLAANYPAATAPTLADPPVVPQGLPSDLLSRRPDIREAEARLAAAQAQVDSAKARYYPSIILTGGAGKASADLSDLFAGPATFWNLAAGLTQPIFGLRRIEAQVDAAKARAEQAEAAYVGTVQTAFKEAFDALERLQAANESRAPVEARVAALRESLRIADARYKAGSSPYLDVLDAERNLLVAQLDAIETSEARLLASVDVFRALGGGWSQQ